jgi:hypothetical protein
MKRPDVFVTNCGSLMTFKLATRRARQWVSGRVDATPWQWMDRETLVVDQRMARALAEGMVGDGLVVR